MYKSSMLCRLAICRRSALLLVLWLGLLLGAYESHQASQQGQTVQGGLKRLALLGFVLRSDR